MSRTAQPRETHEAECNWIESAWPEEKGSFRNSQKVFNEYVEMQADFARMDGFPDLAEKMLGFRQFVPHGKR